MAKVSEQKWPVEMKLVQTTNSLMEEFNLFFLSGIVDEEQLNTLKSKMPILSVFEIGGDKLVFSTLVNQRQLQQVYDEFVRLAKEWRGKYYSLTNKFVEVCKPILKAKK